MLNITRQSGLEAESRTRDPVKENHNMELETQFKSRHVIEIHTSDENGPIREQYNNVSDIAIFC